MEQPDFDIFDYYHGVPEAPLDMVSVLLCNNNEDKGKLEQILAEAGKNLRVSLVEEWYATLSKKAKSTQNQ
jgi:hypothetical protein